jgi:hypothetical protein
VTPVRGILAPLLIGLVVSICLPLVLVLFHRPHEAAIMNRPIIFALITTLLLTATAQARLGETLDQLTKRYGQPLNAKPVIDQQYHGRVHAHSFAPGNYKIFAELLDGKCYILRYELNAGDIEALLKANAANSTWTKASSQRWLRDDQKALAYLDSEDGVALFSLLDVNAMKLRKKIEQGQK